MAQPRSVLFLDEDQELSQRLCDAVVALGCDAFLAKEDIEAKFKLENQKFFLIVADIEAPKLKSDQLEGLILHASSQNETNVLITSKALSIERLNRLSHKPRVRFLPKPVEFKKLVFKIRDIIREVDESLTLQTNSLDVRVVNPLISCAMEKLSPVFEAIKPSRPYLRKNEEVAGDITAMLGILSSGFKGNIALSFSKPDYFRVLLKIMQIETTELSDDCRDAIAEIINGIAEAAQALFQKDSLSVVMTKPSIISQPKHKLQFSSGRPPLVLTFKNDQNEGFRMEISLER